MIEPGKARIQSYVDGVLSGEIVAGPHVRNACKRHNDDVKRQDERGLYQDEAAIQHVFNFFELGLKLSEGQFEGKPFILHPAQAFIIGSIFGWKRKDTGTRRFRRAYVEIGKGNGKSPTAGGIALYGLTADSEPGAQIFAAASKREQAEILFQDAVKMVRASPALSKRVKASGGQGREFNLAHHASQSYFRPISKEAGKTGSGPRPHFILADEIHEMADRRIMELLERGFKFRRQPLLLMITNSGSDRNSVCWEEHEHAVRVAAGTRTPDDIYDYVGEIIDDTTFSYVCALDKGDDPLEDRSCWVKANPLLGTILTEDYLAGVASQAKALPGNLNGILRLHFCCWTDSDEAWMSRASLEGVLADVNPEKHIGKDIYVGCDLSASQDFSILACVVETERTAEGRSTFELWVEAWTPKDTLTERGLRDRAPYDVWVRDGFLNAIPGKMIQLDYIAARLAELNATYNIKTLAYDRYGYRKLSAELDAIGVQLNEVEHPQGGKKRARPTEDQLETASDADDEKPLGLWMPGSIKELEALIFEGRIRIQNNPVLISAIMGAALERDPFFDNYWFSKRKATIRIDAVVSAAMAVGAATTDASDNISNRLNNAIRARGGFA